MNRTRTSKNAKRLLVWLLLLTMVFGLLPMAAFADETVVEPVVSEEPVQEPEPSSEPTEAPSEPTQEPTQEPEPEQPGNAVVTIEGDEEQPEDELDTAALVDYSGYQYSIVMVDCGRKYYSVENINAIIDSASAAGMHYVMLAVGNNGMRFLLDDMSLTVGGKTYTHDEVSKAIHNGNLKYDADTSKTKGQVYDPYTRGDTTDKDVEELTQNDMNAIMRNANDKGVQIIPLINTPGHMGAILSAATELTGVDCAYNSSVTTIDLSNSTALEFTKALLQKYITYFKDKGCTMFNMGSDEYANDSGRPSFNTDMYASFITYINSVAGMIKNAGMTPMAFNDGIYYNGREGYGTIDTDILVCYWSPGWDGYNLAKVNDLINKGFKVINTNGGYYWVVGGYKCSADTAAKFNPSVFNGEQTVTSDNTKSIAGAMFCIWGDEPGSQASSSVPNEVSSVIKSFGNTLPATEAGSKHKNLNDTTPGGGETGGGGESGGGSTGGGSTGGETQKPDVTVKLTVGQTTETPYTQDGDYSNIKNTADDTIATVATSAADKPGKTTYESTKIGEGTFWISTSPSTTTEPPVKLTFESVGNNECYVKKANGQYIYPDWYYIYGYKYDAYLRTNSSPVKLTVESFSAGYYEFSYTNSYNDTAYLTYENGSIGAATDSGNNTHLYLLEKKTTSAGTKTTITFTGVKPGTTTCQIGDTLYEIIVDYKQKTVNAVVGGRKTVENVSGKLDTNGLDTGVATVTLAGNSLAITGVGEGTTSVIVGNTKYTIVVTKEDLAKVTPLPLEYWITNASISSVNGSIGETRNLVNPGTDRTTYEAYYTNVAATLDNIASAEGVSVLNNIAPSSTEHDKRDVYYWHCRMLDTTEANTSTSETAEQTGDGGDDDTTSGVSFTKIRYYNGEWEVYTEKYEWVAVDTSKHQLVAYYREHVKVSDEVESYAADWGNRGDGSTGGWIGSEYCTLSVQVVYEDNTTNPISTSAADLKSKTIVYGYWSQGRGIGTVMFDGEKYEIYKVTSETGTATATISNSNSANVTEFVWNSDEETVWEGDPSASVTIHNPSNGYSNEGVNKNLCWTTNKEAILLRVYIRAKATPDTLTVHYIDKTDPANLNEFYSYNITVGKDTKFSADFKRTDDGTLVGNTVDNINGVTQTVQYDLKQMKEIGAQYRYASFVFVDASREASGERAGMDVYLYYTFNRNRTFVVDFGIPLVITPAALNADLAKANITNVDVSSTSYADITAEPRTWNINYKLKTTLDKSDTFSAYYKGTKVNDKGETVSDEAPYTIEIIPASSVYYEESFVTFTGGKNTAVAAQWTDDSDGTEQSANQQLSALGSGAIYGNDEAYNESTKFSLGNAKKVTITNDMLNGWTSDSAWPTATFTFEGTGFDVISLTSNTTAAIAVNLVGTTANGEQVSKKYMVNTYYGYKYNGTTEKWEIDPDSKDALYQIPVLAVKDLDYGKYTATIMPFYNVAFDMQGTKTNDFWLDAIRVYDPLGEDYTRYTADDEGFPQYIKLRDKVADGEAAADNDVLFIDGADKAKVENYKNYGPNNEVYLGNGQAISFKLPANTDIATIQIGAKSPNASNPSKAKMKVDINGTVSETEIGTATEMYYKISDNGNAEQQVTIANTGDAILSLTNIKVTYGKNNSITLLALTDSDAEAAVATVCALFAEPDEPEKTFDPKRFDCEWSKNVRKGGRAILTVKASTDVEYILIDGVKYDKYVTRTERTGRGWNAQRVTYREFVYMITADGVGTFSYDVVAVNNEGVQSAAEAAVLTVKASSPIRDWIGGLFGRWF